MSDPELRRIGKYLSARIDRQVNPTKIDRSGSIARAVAIPVVVAVIGGWCAQIIAGYYSQQQQLIARKDAEEKFLSYLDGGKFNEQQRYIAIQSLIELQAYDTAADLLVNLPHDYQRIDADLAEAKKQKQKQIRLQTGQDNQLSDAVVSAPAPLVKEHLNCYAASVKPEDQEDCNVSSLLFRYHKVLLHRLLFRAGQRADPYSERSRAAVRIIMEQVGTRDTEQVAFAPVIRRSNWFLRGMVGLRATWTEVMGSADANDNEVSERRGAVESLTDLIRAERQAAVGTEQNVVRVDQFLAASALPSLNSLAPPLVAVVRTDDTLLYDEDTRLSALDGLRGLYSEGGIPHSFLQELREIAMDKKTPGLIRSRIVQRFLILSTNVDGATIDLLNTLIQSGRCDDACNSWFASPLRRHLVHEAVIRRLAVAASEADGLIRMEFRTPAESGPLIGIFKSGDAHRRQAVLAQLYAIYGGKSGDSDWVSAAQSYELPIDHCERPELVGVCDLLNSGLQDADSRVREAAYRLAFDIGRTPWKIALERLTSEQDATVLVWLLVHWWDQALDMSDGFDCAVLPVLKTQIDNIRDDFQRATARPYLDSRLEYCKNPKNNNLERQLIFR
jgi:hypothetical protein